MKLFTFSGMAFRLKGTNPGIKLQRMALAVRDALNAHHPDLHASYEDQAATGVLTNTRHFTSDINIKSITVNNLEGLFTLSARKALDAESAAKAPGFAARMLQEAPPDDPEPIGILSHSQGTNNATYTLEYLRQNHPAFFNGREIRLIMLDPKVDPKRVKLLYDFGLRNRLQMLFFQSELDLLDSQEVGRRKFFLSYKEASFGNHVWVGGLLHDEVNYWNGSKWNDINFGPGTGSERLFGDPGMASVLPVMSQKRYLAYSSAYLSKTKNLPNGAQYLLVLQKIKRDLQIKYALPNRRPSELLISFLAGSFNPLPDKSS